MKKTIYYTIVVILLTSLGLQSCKKENINSNTSASNNQISSGLQVQNGRLVFNSIADMNAQIVKYNGKTKSYIDSLESAINFNSNWKTNQNINLKNWTTYCINHDSITPVIPCNIITCSCLSKVINNRGEVKIKDSIYYFTPNNVYVFLYVNESQVQNIEKELHSKSLAQSFEKELNSQSTSSVLANVRSLPVRTDTIPINLNRGNEQNFVYADARYQYQWTTNGFPYKIVYQFLITTWGYNCVANLDNFLQYQQHGSWYAASAGIYKQDYTWFNFGTINQGCGLPFQMFAGPTIDNTDFAIGFPIQTQSFSYPVSEVEVTGSISDWTTCFQNNISEENAYTVDGNSPGNTNGYLWFVQQ
jgi:hypothetical protein